MKRIFSFSLIAILFATIAVTAAHAHCSWINGAGTRFCPNPTTGGTSYCAAHKPGDVMPNRCQQFVSSGSTYVECGNSLPFGQSKCFVHQVTGDEEPVPEPDPEYPAVPEP